MKIQCTCGAKYSFDVTPGMVHEPVTFVCPACGLDSSDFVNEMIRREAATATPAPGASTVEDVPPIPSTLARGTARQKILAAKPAEPSAPPTEAAPFCSKHAGQRTTHLCLVCQKPICPKCMELFGYVCSPFCKAKAEAQRIDIPVYAGQKSVVEARHWRKVGAIGVAVALLAAGVIGFWIWYAWFGSVPRPVFSVRFTEPARSGESSFCPGNQIVFLHGDTLARCDLKLDKEIWSRRLLDPGEIAKAVDEEVKSRQALINRANFEAWDNVPRMPSREELTQRLKESAAAALQLHVSGQNIWVAEPDKLVRYDWDTGKPVKQIPMRPGLSRPVYRGDEALVTDFNDSGREIVTHVDLASGKSSIETIGEPLQHALAASALAQSAGGNSVGRSPDQPTAGLPVGVPGADAGKPMEPSKVAQQAQRLPLPAKIALPALLANEQNQERIMNELNDQPDHRKPAAPATPQEPAQFFSLIPSKQGYVEFSVRLLERRMVTRTAMKAPPKKSALDGNVNVTQTAAVANEILNEIQRSRGGDTVTEDESRYKVVVRLPDTKGAADWSGEVIGPPALHPLKTVNVVTAGKTIIVLDKTNKKLWQCTLSYNLPTGPAATEAGDVHFGEGPCVERDGSLYVFDQAVLTAFDLVSGNACWRIPSVGVAGLFFDDKGMMYVNTTTASPDSIKYSRQIDVTQKTSAEVMKIDPKTGKTLWTAQPGGFISYVSGKYIYLVNSYQADDEAEPNPYGVEFENPSHVMIERLDPGDGHVMWQHYQKRAPLDVRFDGNRIQIVFKKEVQVLKFLSL